jgi:patatin-like phospholipase/acyl hydrolase
VPPIATTGSRLLNNTIPQNRSPYAYVDGGLFANNPTMCAYVEAYRKLAGNPTAKDMVILSLGTGKIQKSYPYRDVKDWGMVQWIRPLIDIMMASASETVDYQMAQLFATHGRRNNYLRLQPIITTNDKALAALDNVAPENIERLLGLGIKLADENEAQLDAIVEMLLPMAEPAELNMIPMPI